MDENVHLLEQWLQRGEHRGLGVVERHNELHLLARAHRALHRPRAAHFGGAHVRGGQQLAARVRGELRLVARVRECEVVVHDLGEGVAVGVDVTCEEGGARRPHHDGPV